MWSPDTKSCLYVLESKFNILDTATVKDIFCLFKGAICISCKTTDVRYFLRGYFCLILFSTNRALVKLTFRLRFSLRFACVLAYVALARFEFNISAT